MATEKDTSFKTAYQTLRTNAETLRKQTEPDIDNLLSLVQGSISAYQVCKERIDAVDKALNTAFAAEPGARETRES